VNISSWDFVRLEVLGTANLAEHSLFGLNLTEARERTGPAFPSTLGRTALPLAELVWLKAADETTVAMQPLCETFRASMNCVCVRPT
jgi:hypothetical protein